MDELIWAGFLALANEARGRPFGFINAALYSLAAGGNTVYFREITKGNNKPAGSSLGYDAGPGWNACSGLGVMRGAALFATLTGSAGTAVTDVASK